MCYKTGWFVTTGGNLMPAEKVRDLVSRATTVLALLTLTAVASAHQFEKGDDGGILVPASAETLFYSGSINFAMPEGCGRRDVGRSGCAAGDMEAQGTAILQGFRDRLEARGWSMENVVRANVYGVAGPDGKLDFAGFNRAFAKFFSREEGGWYPSRTFVEVKALFRPELLVEVEIVAMKVRE
jgi:enamine deaminase RidA (YjgF/YER057c/UK114 family)